MLLMLCESVATEGADAAMAEENLIGRRCERAVITAYSELRQVGTDDMSAFQACTALYRIHHPEASLSEARRLVAEWIDHHLVRQDSSATDGCLCE
jgi:streptomycin 6-kinase